MSYHAYFNTLMYIIYVTLHELVCAKEEGCVRHPPDCDSIENCNVILKTSRNNITKELDVEIKQRHDNEIPLPDGNTSNVILPTPLENDMMFFVLGKKSGKEKFMYMCHLSQKRVRHLYLSQMFKKLELIK